MVQLRELSPTNAITIALSAAIDSALCVGAGGSSGSLADKPIVRSADGQLLIPASQLKGRLRHECEKLARGLGWPICESPTPNVMCPQIESQRPEFRRTDYAIAEQFADGSQQYHCWICQIFGNPALPSRLVVDDLVCQVPTDRSSEVVRPGVTLNRRRHTAEDRKLYFLETSPVNVKLPFVGHIHLMSEQRDRDLALILAALQHIRALGGSKSVGLGWLSWEVTPKIAIDDAIWEQLPRKKSGEGN